MSATANNIADMDINNENNKLINWISNNKLFHYVVIIILPLIVYYSTTGFGYSGLDDTLIIRDHIRTLQNIHNFRFLFCTDAFLRNPGGGVLSTNSITELYD